jgi:hypothetical protein
LAERPALMSAVFQQDGVAAALHGNPYADSW